MAVDLSKFKKHEKYREDFGSGVRDVIPAPVVKKEKKEIMLAPVMNSNQVAKNILDGNQQVLIPTKEDIQKMTSQKMNDSGYRQNGEKNTKQTMIAPIMNQENNIAPINEELNVIKYEAENIKNMIYTIRGKQVMLDSDVAMLYHYETKNVNKAMKRNRDRFPEDFCFQLEAKEVKQMWFQNGTTFEKENIKYRSEKYLPYVYTEQGIAMLSGLLKNEIAIQVSINIMRAFVEMRKFILNNGPIFERLTTMEYKMLEHDKKFDKVFNELQRNKKEEFSLKVAKTNKFHDRFIAIDNKELYHIGGSLKDLGKKCFAINKMQDIDFIISVEKYI